MSTWTRLSASKPERHPAPAGPLDRLTYLAVLRDDTAAAIDAEIDRLHSEGVNYGKIATALGISRQAVRQRHARYQDRQQAATDVAPQTRAVPAGTMPSLAQIRSYLSRTGWERRGWQGINGIWFLHGSHGVTIPQEDWDELNIMAIVEHIAASEGRAELVVLRAIKRERGTGQ